MVIRTWSATTSPDKDERYLRTVRCGPVLGRLARPGPREMVRGPDGATRCSWALGKPTLRGPEAIRAQVSATLSMPGFATTMSLQDARVAESRDIGYTFGTYGSSLGEGRTRLA